MDRTFVLMKPFFCRQRLVSVVIAPEDTVRNLMMIIGYDGTGYAGFQVQPQVDTVQGRLEQAIEKLTGEQIKVHGSGRTDAGVHARAQVAHFHTESKIPAERWCLALNSRLPDDIVVYEVREVPLAFHSRRSAKRKTYHYCIQQSKFPTWMYGRDRIHIPQRLDYKKMQQGLTAVVGEHDFTSFCSTRTDKVDHVRHIYQAELEWVPEPLPGDESAGVLILKITGNGFLYNMVRIIMGTLIQIGRGKRPPEDMKRILEARDRGAAGPTAVAHGLTLWQVEYD